MSTTTSVIKRIRIPLIRALGALLTSSISLSIGEPVAVTNEVWISATTTNAVGTGTLADPYSGSGGNFDLWMRKWTWGQIGPDGIAGPVRSNLTIHLLPGIYQTGYGAGSTPLPYGTKLKGAGLGNTTLRLSNVNTTGDAAVLAAGFTNISLGEAYFADMTLDCNWGGANVSANKISGLNLYSDGGAIERVKVINYGATGNADPNTQETFPLSWSCPGGIRGSITIQGCSVEGPVKGGANAYATCISAFGKDFPPPASSVKLINNRVVNVTNGIAYAIGGLNGVLEGNFASGCGQGLNLDSWRNENCVIRGNTFRDVAFGLNVGTYFSVNGTFLNFLIENNFLEINDRFAGGSSGSWPTAMQFNGNTTNFAVRANIIVPIRQYMGVVQSNWYGFAFHGGLSQSQGDGENTKYVMENNLVDVAFTNSLWTGFFPAFTDGSYFFNNHDLKGRSLRVFPPDNARRAQTTTVTLPGTSYTLSDDPSKGEMEGHVGLNTQGSATKTITLPFANWHSGRRFTLGISNTTSGAPTACSIILANTSGDAPLYDIGSQSFGATFSYQVNASGYLVLELFSNGGNWGNAPLSQ